LGFKNHWIWKRSGEGFPKEKRKSILELPFKEGNWEGTPGLKGQKRLLNLVGYRERPLPLRRRQGNFRGRKELQFVG